MNQSPHHNRSWRFVLLLFIGSVPFLLLQNTSATSLSKRIAATSKVFLPVIRTSGQALGPIKAYLPIMQSAPEPLTDCIYRLPEFTFPNNHIMQPIADIDMIYGSNDLATAFMIQGHLAFVQSEDNQNFDGGIEFFNFLNPYKPGRVSVIRNSSTYEIREAHSIGYTIRDGRHYVALLAARGLMIWDWTNIRTPFLVSYTTFDSTSSHPYNDGGFWVTWHGNTIYFSQGTSGILVIDATNIHSPRIHREIRPSRFGGFAAGSIQTLGNYMYVGASGEGLAIFDISDPLTPILTYSTSEIENQYSMLVNGDIAYVAAKDNTLKTFDISNPRAARFLGSVGTQGKGGYVSYQDGYAYIGASSVIGKIDVTNPYHPQLVGTANGGEESRDHDFATVAGNMIIIGDDHNEGSFIVPHQSEPDTLGPVVNRVVPAPNALDQAPTTAIGISFSDQIELTTVNSETVIIRPLGGDALPGVYTYQLNLLTFQPSVPLEANTTYEIVIPALGVRDWSCNMTETTFSSTFSTGSFIDELPACSLTQTEAKAVGEPIQFSGTQTAGYEQNTTWAWDFDDGSTVSDNKTPTHTYTEPGLYNVRATVTNPVGSSSCQIQQNIYVTPTAIRPNSTTSILIDNNNSKVWNVNPDNNTVSAIDLNTFEKLSETVVGTHPRTLAIAPDETLWVVNEVSATVSILDAQNAQIIETIALPHASRPYGIVFNPVHNEAYISLQATGEIIRIDATTRTELSRRSVVETVRGMAVSADGQTLYASRFISPEEHGEVIELNASTLAIERTIQLMHDLGPDTEISGRGVPNGLGSPLITPDGGRLLIPSKKDNNIERGAAIDGATHDFESTVRSIVSHIEIADGKEQYFMRRDLNNRDMATAITTNPRGDFYFVATQGTNGVDIFHRYSNELISAIDNAGLAPQGLVISADGTHLFVHSFMSRTVEVYDISELVNIGRNQVTKLTSVPVVADEQLTPTVLAGKKVFYDANDIRINQDSYIACASCHLDQRDDGRNWERSGFGEGLRNTISLLGHGGSEQGRLHWSANFDEVQDFEHDMREQFGGNGMLSSAQFNMGSVHRPLGDSKATLSEELDALDAYVNSLTAFPQSPHRTAAGELTTNGIAGRELFIASGCASCHQGTQFTDGMIHNVGTLSALSGMRTGMPLLGIETPTLRGLWETPPYLHNGSAATLDAVLDQHNNGIVFSSAERDDLIAFLMQIDADEPGMTAFTSPITMSISSTQAISGTTVVISATTNDTLTPVTAVTFYADGVALHTDTVAPYNYEWTPTAEGYVLVSAAATHASGYTSIANEETMVEILPE